MNTFGIVDPDELDKRDNKRYVTVKQGFANILYGIGEGIREYFWMIILMVYLWAS